MVKKYKKKLCCDCNKIFSKAYNSKCWFCYQRSRRFIMSDLIYHLGKLRRINNGTKP